MIEAGYEKLYEFDITLPMENEMREAVKILRQALDRLPDGP